MAGLHSLTLFDSLISGRKREGKNKTDEKQKCFGEPQRLEPHPFADHNRSTESVGLLIVEGKHSLQIPA